MSCWLYKGKCLEVPPRGYYGFTYVITDDTGKKYYGKKAFSHRRKTKLSRKAQKIYGKRIKIEQVDSKWLNYWGSSKPLLEYIKSKGTKDFKREVIKLCKDKSSLTYWETSLLFEKKVMFEDSWNGHILSRFFKGRVKK